MPLNADVIHALNDYGYNNHSQIEELMAQMSKDSNCWKHCPLINTALVKIDGIQFLLLREIGSGYCGISYKAIELSSAKYFVIKNIQPSSFFPDILREELLKTGENERAVIATLYRNEMTIDGKLLLGFKDPDANPSQEVVIKPFFPGTPLDKFDLPKEPKKLLTLMINVTTALKEVHAIDLVHGDIKPANILVDAQTLACRCIDFGLSRKSGYSSRVPFVFNFTRKQNIGFAYDNLYEVTQQNGVITTKADIAVIGNLFLEWQNKNNELKNNNQLTDILICMTKTEPLERLGLDATVVQFKSVVQSLSQGTQHYSKSFINTNSKVNHLNYSIMGNRLTQ